MERQERLGRHGRLREGHRAAPFRVARRQVVSLASMLSALVPATAPAASADVVLSQAQHQQTTIVKVGQTVQVADVPGFTWNVSYRPAVLRALTPPAAMSKPGPSGWSFGALAPGHTEIVLESIAPPCPGETPCAPNIVRWVFPIQVVPS